MLSQDPSLLVVNPKNKVGEVNENKNKLQTLEYSSSKLREP